MASVDYNTRLDGMDALFLKAERPRRWMTVTSIWTFKNDLSIEAVYKVFETLCEEFPRFALIPQDKGWFRPYAWANPVDWTPQTNIIEHLLQEPTKKAFQKYCAEQTATPFNYNKPLWELHVIYGLEGGRCACFWKAHHCLADGEGFIRSLLRTTSLGSTLKKMEKQSLVSHRKRKSRNEFQEAIPNHLWKKLPSWGVTLLGLFCIVLWNLYIFIIAASHDLYMLLAASIPLLSRRDLYYNGLQSHDKEMAWSDDVDMKDIKVVRDAFGGTLNDVMLAVVTRCIKSYLDDLNIRRDNYVQLIIPISLREPSDWSFHNVVSGTWGFFSMKDLSAKGLIRQVKREMLSIKNSITPRILYDFFQALLRFAPGLSPPTKFYDYYCDMPHGVFTNVPGTTLPIAFAGEEVQEFRLFPPQSGKGSIGIALISYCGKVSIGAIADIHRKYPGLANGVCNRFTEEFDSILEEAKIELSKKKKL